MGTCGAFHAERESVRVEDAILPGGAVEVPRREVLRACKKEHVLEAFQSLVEDAVSVLRDNRVTVDRIVPLGAAAQLEELQLHLKRAVTRFTRSKLLGSPANTPQAAAAGAGRLLALVRAGEAAVDPAFVGAVFWPDAATEAANRKAWETAGTLKITHTQTNVERDAAGEEAALEAELRAFAERERAEEGYRVALKGQRAALMEDWQRAQRNWLAMREQAEKEERELKEAKAKEAEKEMQQEKEEEKKEEKPEEKAEEKPEEKAAEKKPEEKPAEETPAEETPVENKENADEAAKQVHTTLESVSTELDAILALINNDAFLREATENQTVIEQRIEACQQQLVSLSPRFPSVTLDLKVVAPGKLCFARVT